jgi:hypothetical protein
MNAVLFFSFPLKDWCFNPQEILKCSSCKWLQLRRERHKEIKSGERELKQYIFSLLVVSL